jgi:S1/P1 Nuclease
MRVLLSLVLMCLGSQSVLGWGQEGHAIIAEIAQRHLSNGARVKVVDMLGPGVSLASIASWADDIRSVRPETYNWHFVDIPLDAVTYEANRDCRPIRIRETASLQPWRELVSH